MRREPHAVLLGKPFSQDLKILEHSQEKQNVFPLSVSTLSYTVSKEKIKGIMPFENKNYKSMPFQDSTIYGLATAPLVPEMFLF